MDCKIWRRKEIVSERQWRDQSQEMFHDLRHLNDQRTAGSPTFGLVWSNRFAAKWCLLWSLLTGPNALITCAPKQAKYPAVPPTSQHYITQHRLFYYIVNEEWQRCHQRIDLISIKASHNGPHWQPCNRLIHRQSFTEAKKCTLPPPFSFSDLC